MLPSVHQGRRSLRGPSRPPCSFSPCGSLRVHNSTVTTSTGPPRTYRSGLPNSTCLWRRHFSSASRGDSSSSTHCSHVTTARWGCRSCQSWSWRSLGTVHKVSGRSEGASCECVVGWRMQSICTRKGQRCSDQIECRGAATKSYAEVQRPNRMQRCNDQVVCRGAAQLEGRVSRRFTQSSESMSNVCVLLRPRFRGSV